MLGYMTPRGERKNAYLQKTLNFLQADFSSAVMSNMHILQDFTTLNSALKEILSTNEVVQEVKINIDNVLGIHDAKFEESGSEHYNFKALELLHQLLHRAYSQKTGVPQSSVSPPVKLEEISLLKKKHSIEIYSYKILLSTLNKQLKEFQERFRKKTKQISLLKSKIHARFNPYYLFEKKIAFMKNDQTVKVPMHICQCQLCDKVIDEDTGESTMDMTEEIGVHQPKTNIPKFIDEPWKTISDIQSNLKNVDVENKALHEYLTTLKLEEKFSEEAIMASDIVQKLLKQGLILLKHSETLRKSCEDFKLEISKLKAEHASEIAEYEDQNTQIQQNFKNKLSEISDDYLKLVNEKEHVEVLYSEAQNSEKLAKELEDSIKEYQKIADDNIREKEIMKKKYQDLKKQFESLLKKKAMQGEKEIDTNIGSSNPTEVISALKIQIERLETAEEEQKVRVDALEEEIEHLTNVNNSLSTQKIKIIQKLDIYAHNQAKFVKANTKSSKVLKVAQLEKDNYLKVVADKDQQIEMLTTEINNLILKAAKFEGQVNQLQAALHSKEEVLNMLKAESSTIIIKNDEYKLKLDTHNGIIEELHSRVSSLQSKLSKKKIQEDRFISLKQISSIENDISDSNELDQKMNELSYLRKKLKCELCFENEKNIILSPCFHVFCSTCVYSHSKGVRRKNNRISRNCPKCDTRYTGFQLLWL
ncbi:unnamed protein product [Moneuplotes crassus]|uniref:E3 ubiquitin protein ligase n=1 Tax=Euplotes crassus TaxID=5936 RepID=A0AAD2DAJ5_EUPCR|nr:unnamed protein product [Moneuplotes crassus]